MKPCTLLAAVAVALLPAATNSLPAAETSSPTIYETPREFFGSGDFDGDGHADLVIVDKDTGKYRLGYALPSGLFSWVDCRPSGIKGISGFSIGKLFPKSPEALVFTSPDANAITMVRTSPARRRPASR